MAFGLTCLLSLSRWCGQAQRRARAQPELGDVAGLGAVGCLKVHANVAVSGREKCRDASLNEIRQ
jgi:hypothetical protein